MHRAVASLIFAMANLSTAFPQNYVSNGQCPAGCGPIITENDRPDPHQVYFLQQTMTLTVGPRTITCVGNGGCEISKNDVKRQTVGMHADISADGWISAGFDVSHYEESGEVQTCYGDPGDTICVFWRAANTNYTVNIQSNECCRAGPKSPKSITSPNKNDLGSGSICGRNEQCNSKGHSYWNNSKG